MALEPKKIKEMLVVDESKLAEEMLKRVQAHLGLTTDGRVHLRDPSKYRQRDQLLLVLVGARYALDAKLRDSDTLTVAEVASTLGLDPKLVAARLSDLKNEGKVENPTRGVYRIVFPRLLQIINEIEARGPEVS